MSAAASDAVTLMCLFALGVLILEGVVHVGIGIAQKWVEYKAQKRIHEEESLF